MVRRAPFSSTGPDPFRDHHPKGEDSREHNAVVDLPAPVPPAQGTAAMTIYVTRQGDIHLPGFIRDLLAPRPHRPPPLVPSNQLL